MLPYPLPTAKRTATGTTYTSANWKAAGNKDSSSNRSSDSTGASKVATSDSGTTALTSATPSLHYFDIKKLKHKRPTMASKWSKVKEKFSELGSTISQGSKLPKAPEERTHISNTWASRYKDHEPLVPSRPAPSPYPKESPRDIIDKIERELQEFAEYENSQAQKSRESGNALGEGGRSSEEEAPVETGWDWENRQFHQRPTGPAVKISAPPKTHRKQHSGPSNPGPTIHEVDFEEDPENVDEDQLAKVRNDLGLPRQPDRSQYRASMLIEKARRENDWTPAQLLDKYWGGWEPGYDSPQHEPFDMLGQAMLDTDTSGHSDQLKTPRNHHETYPPSHSPSSVYSTTSNPECSMSDSLPPGVLPLPSDSYFPSPTLKSFPQTHEAYAFEHSPPPSPGPKSRSETSSLFHPPRNSSLPSATTSRERQISRFSDDSYDAARMSAEASAQASSERVRSGGAIWHTKTDRGLDGYWQVPMSFIPVIRDPRMRPPNYCRWNSQQCGGWF